MRRPHVVWFVGALVAAGALLAGAPPAPAAESALAGNWKTIVSSQSREFTVWLLQVKDGEKGGVSILSVADPNFKNTTVEKSQLRPNALHLDLAVKTPTGQKVTFEVSAHLPKGEKQAKVLYGTIKFNNQEAYLRLEKTDAKELDKENSSRPNPAFGAFQKALEEKGEAKIKALKEIQDKYPNDPLAITAGSAILRQEVAAGAKEAEIRTQVERIIKTASLYGPGVAANGYSRVVTLLLPSKKYAGLALSYARQAEKSLPKGAPASQRIPVLKNLALALDKTGKGDEAKKVQGEVARLDEEMDREFEKTAIPFKPEKFKGRKKAGDRVVLVELFTGAQCPPCVAADIAFDASLKTYTAKEAALLEYHLHIPGPDPLTNKDTEARAQYYEKEIPGTPTVLLDGKKAPALGGYKQHGKDSYEKLTKAINEDLEEKPQAQVKLTARRKGDKVELTADVSGLEKTGEDVRLRFVLVEEVARYQGGNGQRLHHHVVRAMPGGPKGFALTKKADKQTVTVDLKELARSLNDYMAENKFAEADRPLQLKHFLAVAFVQDDKDKAVFQAAQVEVPAEVR